MEKSKILSSAENAYDAFVNSPQGSEAWDYVYETFPDYNKNSLDTDRAVDYLLNEIESFLNLFSETIFSSYEEELGEIFYAGLT